MTAPQSQPIIGITVDLTAERYQLGRSYGPMVQRAAGLPVILPCCLEAVDAYLGICHGFILSGGDDPIMEHWGVKTHPKANPIDPQRQAFELALLDGLTERPDLPVLGICLGMQMMTLHAGGRLDQHLPDTLVTADDHWGRKQHAVSGELGRGLVHSHHRQAITDPGALRVVATAPDGVIEAVQAVDRRFYLGVQWHPERTEETDLGRGLFERLIARCRVTASC
ncbi:MAG: type 1 glutamine amidotransferase [Phycisphaerales bacterium]|nr:MAG: type 1 glutamine amidotransferase [Phycisphaerales bacterium]